MQPIKQLSSLAQRALQAERARSVLIALTAGASVAFICGVVTLSLIAGAAPKPENVADMTVAEAMGALHGPRPAGVFAIADHPFETDSDQLTLAANDPFLTAPSTLSPATVQQLLHPADCVTELERYLAPLFVQFDLGSTNLPAQSSQLLSQISDEIIICQDAFVMVAGHADSSGEDAINMALSQQRADSTLDRLIAMGVNPNAVESVGFGAQQPLSQGSDDEEDRDRRVEFRVIRRNSN